MKRIILAALCLVMALSTLAFAGCDNSPANNADETLKLGLGVHIDVTKATDANEDKDGEGNVVITAAVVTVDKNGKIVDCKLDCADNTVKYTLDGKAVAVDSFKTKYEMGADYNMMTYGGAKKEWFEQVDAFTALVKGKTLSEVKAMVVNGDKGSSDVIAAGCTITVNEFVLAIEKAYNNASTSNATAAHTLKLGVHTQQTTQDANEDKNGKNEIETTLFAAAVDKDGKIVAATTDAVQVTFAFDSNGASKTDITKAVVSKRQAGDDYGMVAWGGAKNEWHNQADAFAAACIGKTASNVASLMGSDNYGKEDIKNAGCTILVNGFVKAASKLK